MKDPIKIKKRIKTATEMIQKIKRDSLDKDADFLSKLRNDTILEKKLN